MGTRAARPCNHSRNRIRTLTPRHHPPSRAPARFVTYKWPSWLHKQTEKQRIIWAYKILFLDVLFPLGLKKVIFCDSGEQRGGGGACGRGGLTQSTSTERARARTHTHTDRVPRAFLQTRW